MSGNTMRTRLNVFLELDHAKRLRTLAAMKGVSKSAIVATALASYLSPEGMERREATIEKRLDRLTHQFERLERDQTILLETLALFIRYQLAISVSAPEGQQEAIRAQGKARFEKFIEQLARHLQRGGSLVKDVHTEISPDKHESFAGGATNSTTTQEST